MAYSTTFRQDLREDFAHIVTSNEHEELIRYYPKDGGPREIRALVEPDAAYEIDEPRLQRVSRLEVTLSRDELNQVFLNDVAAGHGGVIRPQRGDQLVRIEHDPEQRRYVLSLVIEDKPHSYTLEFKLMQVRRTGNEHFIPQL